MSSFTDQIRYYRDCYRADRRAGALLDLFAKKIEHLQFLDDRDEILGGFNPIPVPRSAFQTLADNATLYALEKTVVFGAFLLVARAKTVRSAPGEDSDHSSETDSVADHSLPQVIVAPLWLFPASVTRDDDYPESSLPLAVNLADGRPNTPLLAAVLGSDELGVEAAQRLNDALHLDTIDDADAEPRWPKDCARRLFEVLADLLPELELDQARSFPELADKESIEAVRRRVKRGKRPSLLTAQCVALVPRSYETRGILHELTEMAEYDQISKPISALLRSDRNSASPSAPTDRPRNPSKGSNYIVPAILSRAQQRAADSARRNPLTLVIGPPGTGKTFTLASLALDHVARGESVLIVAQTQTSLDVLHDKIAQIAGSDDLLIEGGRGKRLRAVKDRLRHLLHGGQEHSLETERPIADLEQRIDEIGHRLGETEEEIEDRAELELAWGDTESARRRRRKPRLIAALKQRFRTWQLERRPPLWESTADLLRLLGERVRCDAERLRARVRQRRTKAIDENRDAIAGLDSALRAQQSTIQSLRFGEVDLVTVLGAFPIWSARFSDLHRLMPKIAELFDLVIVDEATQCDLASPLPALLRGRRAVVTGDPKQLRHLSFLSVRHQATLAERYGLVLSQESSPKGVRSYRDTSLLDLAISAIDRQDQVVTLDEHFRSTPQIIDFSNREFYRGDLRVMSRRPTTQMPESLHAERVSGRRNADGANPIEAEALVRNLLDRVTAEADLPTDRASSIGVLSPFRDQVDHLAEQIAGALPHGSLDRHRIRIGTPYAFQGDERDLMLLSLAIDNDSPAGTLRYLERPDVFNVAITRARNLQSIFYSFDPARFGSSLVGRYLDHALRPLPPHRHQAATTAFEQTAGRDLFLGELVDALTETGAKTWPRFAVAGIDIDLLISSHGGTIGLDLVGHPGAMANLFDLERYRILHRAGLPLMPIPFSTWTRQRQQCLAAIDQACRLEARHSRPSLDTLGAAHDGRSTETANPVD